MAKYEEEKAKKRKLRLMYHTEEQVAAMEAKDLEVERERLKGKEEKKKEAFKALSFAEIKAMDCKKRREYAMAVLENDREVTMYINKVRMRLED